MSVKKLNPKKEAINVEEMCGEVFTLLAGYKDEDGNIHKEFEIIEMTGAEEEAIAKPEIRINGAKVVRTVLERCCIRIGDLTKSSMGLAKWRNIIQNLYVGDQDYMMLKIREQSVGAEVEANHECPNQQCKAKLKTLVNLDELEVMPFKESEFDFELPRGYRDKNGVVHKTGRLRLPKGVDRELLDPIARKNLGEANTLMLTRCIMSLDEVNVTNDIIRGLSIGDRNYLFELLKDYMFGINFNIEIVCDTCGTDFKASLNMANFI